MQKAVRIINRVKRTMPPTCGAEMDSCMTLRCIRPIFRPDTNARETAAVTTPMPPTWISSRITAWPNGDQEEAVSSTTSPVTQTAEVAVNRQSANPALPVSRLESGRESSSVPVRISAINPKAII